MAADPMVDLRRRFTVEEYERMGEVGILDPGERVELLDGEIVAMSPIGPRHAGVVDGITELLYAAALGRVSIRVQNPVRLLPHSEPQPDVVVARRRRDGYRGAHPTAEDTLLVIEVAESALHTDPVDGGYRTVRTARRGETVAPVAVADVVLSVDDVLG